MPAQATSRRRVTAVPVSWNRQAWPQQRRLIAFFVLMPIASGIMGEILKGDTRRWALLGNPFVLITGFANWLFDVEANFRARGGRVRFRPDPLPGTAYLYAMLGTAVVAIIVLIVRYRASERDA